MPKELSSEDYDAIYAVATRFGLDYDELCKLCECTVVDRSFRWDGDKQQHIPRLIVEFEPVRFDGPADEKGWTDRDALAKFLSAIKKD